MKSKILFELWKDTVITGSEYKRAVLQKKYPDVDIYSLHRDIINYQIKKYGNSLNYSEATRDFNRMYMRKRKKEKEKNEDNKIHNI